MSYQDSSGKYTDPAAYDKRHERPLEKYLLQLWKPVLKSYIAKYINSPGPIADLGCGTLEYTQFLTLAKKIYAVDVNRKMLDFGKKKVAKLSGEVTTIVADASHTPLPANSCQSVMALGLTEYVPLNRLLKEAARIVQSKGKVLVTFRNIINPHEFTVYLYNQLRPVGSQKNFYSLFAVKTIAAKNSLRLVHHTSRGLFFWIPVAWQSKAIWLWKMIEPINQLIDPHFPVGANVVCVFERE